MLRKMGHNTMNDTFDTSIITNQSTRINVSIAVALGTHKVFAKTKDSVTIIDHLGRPIYFRGGAISIHPNFSFYDNYVEDLNAIHKAESLLTKHQHDNYIKTLAAIITSECRHPNTHCATFVIKHATPLQCAKAILRVCGITSI